MATCIPSHLAPEPNRTIRMIRYAEELDDLEREWGTHDVRFALGVEYRLPNRPTS